MICRRALLAISLGLGLACSVPAAAQLRLPQLPRQLPSIPSPLDLKGGNVSASRQLDSLLDPRDLLGLRRLAILNLLQQHPDLIEADSAGEPIVRSEVLVLAPSAAALEAAQAAGFTLARDEALQGMEMRLAVLRAPPDMTTAGALERLRQIDAQGRYDFNHIYVGAGRLGSATAIAQQGTTHGTASEERSRRAQPRVGMIDGGVDLHHPSLRDADVRTYGCSGTQVPHLHGTGVASLLVGRAPGFAGAVPGATLYAADVYCGLPTGGAVTRLVDALAWMARERVPVINISLVGPPNRTLEQAIQILVARGHVIVAAVGNEGPAAPPLYPAAYPGVIGVTAVNDRQIVIPEALRGPQVTFAAPGADMATAASGSRGYTRARGTSFAAPLVAGLLANARGAAESVIEPHASRRAIDLLIRNAVDLGPPGRDDTYGFGLLGASLRVDPLTLR